MVYRLSTLLPQLDFLPEALISAFDFGSEDSMQEIPGPIQLRDARRIFQELEYQGEVGERSEYDFVEVILFAVASVD